MKLPGQAPSTFVLSLSSITPLQTELYCIYRGPPQFYTGIYLVFKFSGLRKKEKERGRNALGPGDHTFAKQKVMPSLCSKNPSHTCLLRGESQISSKNKKACFHQKIKVYHIKVKEFIAFKIYTSFQKDQIKPKSIYVVPFHLSS